MGSWVTDSMLLPSDSLYDVQSATGGPYSLASRATPGSPEPVLDFRSDTVLVSRLAGPHSLETASPPSLLSSPSCGCHACASREAHHRLAAGLCCVAFLVLLAVYLSKSR